MPTYEYQCPQGHRFEKFQKMTEKPGAKCPTCGKPAARQISGGAGLVFRGSGFYITDYGKDGKGPRKTREDREARPESKTESKSRRQAGPIRNQALQEGRQRVSDLLRGELARVAATLGADGIDFVLERPRDTGHGDLATNLAMVIARQQRTKPRPIAERVVAELRLPPALVARTEIAGPGFINFWLAQDELALGAPPHPRPRGPATAARRPRRRSR